MDLGNLYSRLRDPYESELEYFKTNPHVGGMATEDARVILNPYSQNVNRDAIYQNELARLYMRENESPRFKLTPEQIKFLDATTYRNASPEDRNQTIAARILSGDPSARLIFLLQFQPLFCSQPLS